MTEKILSPVGKGAANKPEDVKIIQHLINGKDISPLVKNILKVDGVCGDRTIGTIKMVQSFLKLNPDGVVSPSGPTLRYLKTFEFLGMNGPGFRVYGIGDQSTKLYGTASTIAAIKSIASRFTSSLAEEKKILLQVGDIGFKNGANDPNHTSHRMGINVDIRPIRKDNKYIPVIITDTQYDHERTKKLVEIIKGDSNVSKILFNDRLISGVTPWTGHNNHLHVIFKL